MTEAQKWAMNRNWLVRRLLGVKSIFSYDSLNLLIRSMETPEDKNMVLQFERDLTYIIKKFRAVDTFSQFKRIARGE